MLPPNSKIDFRADYAATFVTSNMSSKLKIFSPGTEPPENDDVGSYLKAKMRIRLSKKKFLRRFRTQIGRDR